MSLIPQAYAAITNPVVPGGNSPETGANTLALIIAILWKTIVILGGLAFLIFFLWGGLEWIIAGGDKQKLESAKNKLTQGLIGLAILAGSLVIIKFAGQALGFNPLYIIWPNPRQSQDSNSTQTTNPNSTPNSPQQKKELKLLKQLN